MLKWNETDVIDCLEVLPVVFDSKTKYLFEAIRGGLRLRLTIWPYERQAQLELSSDPDQQPIIAFRLVIRGELKYLKETRIEQLEFTDAVIGPAYHWRNESFAYSHTESPPGVTVILSVKPAIHIQVLDYLEP